MGVKDRLHVNRTNTNDVSKGLDISKTKNTVDFNSRNAEDYVGQNKESFCYTTKDQIRMPM